MPLWVRIKFIDSPFPFNMADDKNEKSDDSVTTTIPSTDENAPEQEFIDGDTRAWLIVVGS